MDDNLELEGLKKQILILTKACDALIEENSQLRKSNVSLHESLLREKQKKDAPVYKEEKTKLTKGQQGLVEGVTNGSIVLLPKDINESIERVLATYTGSTMSARKLFQDLVACFFGFGLPTYYGDLRDFTGMRILWDMAEGNKVYSRNPISTAKSYKEKSYDQLIAVLKRHPINMQFIKQQGRK